PQPWHLAPSMMQGSEECSATAQQTVGQLSSVPESTMVHHYRLSSRAPFLLQGRAPALQRAQAAVLAQYLRHGLPWHENVILLRTLGLFSGVSDAACRTTSHKWQA